jgi:hypothetical protein
MTSDETPISIGRNWRANAAVTTHSFRSAKCDSGEGRILTPTRKVQCSVTPVQTYARAR